MSVLISGYAGISPSHSIENMILKGVASVIRVSSE